jgi:hypothetical protein
MKPSAQQGRRARGPFSLSACLAMLLLVSALGVGAAGASPMAGLARTCKPPAYPGVGYFTSLTVSGTSCATGSKVALEYHHCRLRHGIAGHCSGGVLGFRCSEKRNTIPTEIAARVTCTRGRETVVHTYQQDT